MEKTLIINKSNNLIEASYQLTLDEMRLLALTVGIMEPKSDKLEFDFTVADFASHFGIKPASAYEQVKQAVKKIYERSVKIEDEEKIFEFRWVSSRTYFKREGKFRIALTREVMPYLTQLKGKYYTSYNLEQISTFQSFHSIRIYELLAQFKNTGWRQITVEKLKELLQITDKYKAYANLRRRVITPALEEINSKTDLFVELEPIKNGRTIVALKFLISRQQEQPKIDYEALPKRPRLPQRPHVMAGTHAEGVYFNQCEGIIREHWKGIFKDKEWREILPLLPAGELELLEKYYKATGNDLYKTIRKLLKEACLKKTNR